MKIPQFRRSKLGTRHALGACVLLSLLLFLPTMARADCSAVSSKIPFPFSDAALVNLKTFLKKICDASSGDIYAANDPDLQGRLQKPSGNLVSKDDVYPQQAKQKRLEGTVGLAYVVETDGSIRNAVAIESSGYQSLDRAAESWIKKNRFKSPARLDEKPVRYLYCVPFAFKIRH